MGTKASKFDEKFDDDESIIEYLDLSKTHRPAEDKISPMTPPHSTLKQLPEHGSCFICGSRNSHNARD